ncbi:cupin domain-containing protein [Oceanisphaera psychrotolerans]|uniref:(S)-ureidoglycine aminohydrolase cupin domain-containing protein n=1 Tax=Oceanisphaera psychrotolerans TaxID=1414654 RepID=A0A1J4QCK2_9GAMM|nr:cupin domain-containing protein [Oceanisphaera psychrotolerans]OIN07930.1 hypothetical protein BFR47_16055 [Oceanisphaera psychrotolerans]
MPVEKIVTLEQSEPVSRTSGPKPNPKSGEPFTNNVTYFDHSSGNFKAGTWDCTAGSWEHNHPKLEFCYIVEGSVKIIEEDSGVTHVYNKGDSFVVPKGTRVTWVVEEYAKKLFVSAAHLEGL